MWTAQKTDKGFADGQVYVRVRYTDDSVPPQSFVEPPYRANTIQPDWPDAQIRQRLTELNALDLTKVPLGDIATAPVIKPVDPPTQAELDRRAFFDAQSKLQALATAQANGATVDSKTVSDLKTQYSALYKPEYFGL